MFFKQQNWEHLSPEQRRRNGRIVSFVLALTTIVSLLFLSYAFVQKENARELRADFELKIQAMEQQLQQCQSRPEAAMVEAERQHAIAAELVSQKK